MITSLSFPVLAFAPAAVLLLVFGISVLRERRRVRNGIWLFLAILAAALGAVACVAAVSLGAAAIGLVLLSLLLPLAMLVLAAFLVLNGVTMWRREGRSPGNLLSLLAGLELLGYVLLSGVADVTEWLPLEAVRSALRLVLGYVSLQFVCFLLYSFCYGLLPHRRRADFIIVLGAGLIDGSRVSPLLASRLDKGLAVFRRQRADGHDPVLVASGGRGPGEEIPEARAMADYLLEREVPENRLLLEDASRNTEQNLRFSNALLRERGTGQRGLVVTNNYHVMRAARIARKENVHADVVGSPTARYFLPSATLREFAAVFLDHKGVNIAACLLLATAALLGPH